MTRNKTYTEAKMGSYISTDDVYAAEDAWTDACEEHGAESAEAKDAWDAYQELNAAHTAQGELEDELLEEEF